MIALLLNHLWQSSLCVGGAGLLALALHRNGANVRFWLWFAASVKFLVPFALLMALGATLLTPILPPVAAPAAISLEPLAQPFPAMSLAAAPTAVSAAVPSLAAPPPTAVPAVPAAARLGLASELLALWVAGFLIIALRWLVRWSRVRALLRAAVAAPVDAPIAVKFSSSLLEPGLVGILRPVILLPFGIEQQLSAVELKAVLAHELCHYRRHDNLLATIHMLVEALFWFFPLVWWLGARLNAERERACDESVLADGNDPQMYAEGILKVCRAYLQSPLACVAGISGAGLKKRIDAIMENRLIPRLNAVRKLVLSASAAIVLIPPLLLGLATLPVAELQAKVAAIPDIKTLVAATTSAGRNERDNPPSPTSALQRQSEAIAKANTLPPPSPLPTEAASQPAVASNAPPVPEPEASPAGKPSVPAQPATPDGSAGLVAALTPAPTGSGSANAPHPKTEARLRCMLGLGPEECEMGLGGPSRIPKNNFIKHNNNCTTQYVHSRGPFGYCPDGPLESVEYLGTNAAGADVYVLKYMHIKWTYVISQPAPDGKIDWFRNVGFPCNDFPSSPCAVTSPANPAQTLYTRPAEWK